MHLHVKCMYMFTHKCMYMHAHVIVHVYIMSCAIIISVCAAIYSVVSKVHVIHATHACDIPEVHENACQGEKKIPSSRIRTSDLWITMTSTVHRSTN